MQPKVTTAQFIDLWMKLRSPAEIARRLGVTERSVHSRRRRIEEAMGIELEAPPVGNNGDPVKTLRKFAPDVPVQLDVEFKDCAVVVFSDAHYWPDEISVAHRAMLAVIKKVKPVAVIANGDVFDGASISRHGRIGWQQSPKVGEELSAVQERLAEVKKAAKGARLIRTMGNHDARFETFLAANAPQFEGVLGYELRDHLPDWEVCWSVMANRNTIIKHRYHNGIHAAYNNTLKAGINIVTGHLHRLCVTPWGDYNGRRYGVDTGTLATPGGDQFYYMENNPNPWCSGFVVLTFGPDGELLPPELCEVHGEIAYFRGARVHIP